MAQALRAGLRNGGIRRGGLRPGLGNGSLFAVAPLDLFFARNRTLDPRVTFTRASSGTYVDSQGVLRTAATNEPRFNHNPTTGESLGLLVEESRTNLLPRSEEIATSPWGTNNAGATTYTANVAIAPSGTLTADRVTASADFAGPNQFISATSSLSYALSFYVKAATPGSLDSIRIECFNARFASFNITTKTFSGVNAAITPSFADAGNGWVRVQAVFTAPATATYAVSIYASTSSDFYLWGAQLEAGSSPTSYIPTTTAAATRSADVASITGTNFSSWYRQDEGTVFADVNSAPVNNIAQLTFDISEGAGNERMFQRRNASGIVATAVIDNGATQGDIGSVVIGASARYRSGFAYKLNDLEIVVNGSGSATDTSATMPTPDRLHIGQNYASGQSCNGTLRRLTFWPSRLPGSTLQQITK